MSIKIAKLEDIKPGAVLYAVSGYPGRNIKGYIRKIKIVSKPYPNPSVENSLFVKTDMSSISLCDHNIPVNVYNYHVLCLDKKSAEDYLLLCEASDFDALNELGIGHESKNSWVKRMHHYRMQEMH